MAEKKPTASAAADGYNVVFMDESKEGVVRLFKDDAAATAAGAADPTIHTIKAHRNSKVVFRRERGGK